MAASTSTWMPGPLFGDARIDPQLASVTATIRAGRRNSLMSSPVHFWPAGHGAALTGFSRMSFRDLLGGLPRTVADRKFDLLTLALSETDPKGMWLDWMLRELIEAR